MFESWLLKYHMDMIKQIRLHGKKTEHWRDCSSIFFSLFLSVFCLFLFVCLVFLHIKMYEYCILCSPGCPRTCAVDKAYLGLRESVLPRLRLCSNILSLEEILYGVDDRPQLNCLQIIDWNLWETAFIT